LNSLAIAQPRAAFFLFFERALLLCACCGACSAILRSARVFDRWEAPLTCPFLFVSVFTLRVQTNCPHTQAIAGLSIVAANNCFAKVAIGK
jgi:hypothetical protein